MKEVTGNIFIKRSGQRKALLAWLSSAFHKDIVVRIYICTGANTDVNSLIRSSLTLRGFPAVDGDLQSSDSLPSLSASLLSDDFFTTFCFLLGTSVFISELLRFLGPSDFSFFRFGTAFLTDPGPDSSLSLSLSKESEVPLAIIFFAGLVCFSDAFLILLLDFGASEVNAWIQRTSLKFDLYFSSYQGNRIPYDGMEARRGRGYSDVTMEGDFSTSQSVKQVSIFTLSLESFVVLLSSLALSILSFESFVVLLSSLALSIC
nr:hypothetical protein Iba_chr07cCG8270 [Ipomoea batatas]GMD17730.1 hypothetical protein Iba_chr07dCG6410 [Ipomoea batatas]